MFAKFFIDRPIFAAVLSIVVTLAGGIAATQLPIAQYPSITPPTVQVDCRYPGASAEVVALTVAAPIEQQVNGVEGMMYMSSQATDDGSYNLTVTFQPGINLNLAQVLVQTRVALAVPQLPDVIKQTGVTTRKRSPDILLSVNINSPEGKYDQLYLSNYATIRLRDELARLPGVSDIFITGQRDYAMRVWLDPQKLAARNLTATDVSRALRQQNLQVAAGQLGQPPVPDGQSTQLTLTATGRLTEPGEFANVIVKRGANGQVVRVKDIARVELGARSFDVTCRLDGKESVGMPVFQLPDANALDVRDAVVAKMDELQKEFPPGLIYEIQYDTTPFIRQSIEEVYKTLGEAVVLVALVVLLFLQNWRSAIIPLVAVPVAIIGTFAAMAAVGFSLNNLTLFGLVLAIGIVVDDAIVVVEAVEHHIEEDKSPYDATVQAMREVSGPVIAVALVLCAVFVPCMFITGITGAFFRQFALTIAVSTVISAFNSLTLSPALAARLLPPKEKKHAGQPLPRVVFGVGFAALGYFEAGHWPEAWRFGLSPTYSALALAGVAAAVGLMLGGVLNRALKWFFGAFDWAFGLFAKAYLQVIRFLLWAWPAVLVVYAGLIGLTVWGFRQLPTGFIPNQDMGYLLVNIQLPDAAALERTDAVMRKLEKAAMDAPGVGHVLSVPGQSILLSAYGSNFGSQFILLKDYKDRRDKETYADNIASALRTKYATVAPEALTVVVTPPPLRGIGRAGGYRIVVEDREARGPQRLQGQADNLIDKANPAGTQTTGLVGNFTPFRANSPQLFVDVNRAECLAKGVPLREVFDTLQIFLGSLYVNDFNLFSRTWQVNLQADSRFRDTLDDVKRLKVRNVRGEMVPVGSVAGVRPINGPPIITRYNMYPAAMINGSGAPGVSSGQAIKLMEQLAAQELSQGMKTEWTEMAYLELQAGSTAIYVFGFAVVAVFLVLAAQYESWSLPLAVILVVPMCLLSSIAGVWVADQDINIFTQIGFVVLVGLASKNAILIVEFAKHKREHGLSAKAAALEACQLRLRPIVMTSMAFILGVLPLLISTGAGAEMRRTLGTAVFAGMLGVTLFGLLLTPVFFVVVDGVGPRLFGKWPRLKVASDWVLRLLSLRWLVALGRKLPATRAALVTPPAGT